jgi:hypothetical protein
MHCIAAVLILERNKRVVHEARAIHHKIFRGKEIEREGSYSGTVSPAAAPEGTDWWVAEEGEEMGKEGRKATEVGDLRVRDLFPFETKMGVEQRVRKASEGRWAKSNGYGSATWKSGKRMKEKPRYDQKEADRFEFKISDLFPRNASIIPPCSLFLSSLLLCPKSHYCQSLRTR